MARLLVIGSSNTDLTLGLPELPFPGQTVIGGDVRRGFGGKGANQAVAARMAGAEVVFLTALGDDDIGLSTRQHFLELGLDLGPTRLHKGVPSGVAFIFVDDRGENLIGVGQGANARLNAEEVDQLPADLFARDQVLLIAGLEVPFDAVERATDRGFSAGMRMVVNPAPIPGGPAAWKWLERVDLITPNRIELGMLTKKPVETDDELIEAGRALQQVGPRSVIVTLAGRGVLILDGEQRPTRIKPHLVEVVDTVGAGDAFTGSLAVAVAEGKPLIEAAKWANAAAAIAVTRRGAQSSIATRTEIERMLGNA